VEGLQPDELQLLRNRQLESTDVLVATTQNAAQTQADRSRAKVVFEKLEPVLRLVGRYSDDAKFVSQFAPAPTSLVVDGIKSVITIPGMFLKYQKKVSDRLVLMGKRFAVLDQRYDNLYQEDEALQEVLIRIHIGIIKFCLEAAKVLYDSNGNIRRTAKLGAKSVIQSFEDSELGSLANQFDQDIIDFEETFKGIERSDNAQHKRDTTRTLGDIKDGVKSIQAAASEAKEEMRRQTSWWEDEVDLRIQEQKGRADLGHRSPASRYSVC
jgi:hypothetical protein